MALLPTPNTLHVLTDWDAQLSKTPQLNQPLFNRLIHQARTQAIPELHLKPSSHEQGPLVTLSLKVGALDRSLFPSGDLYFGGKEGVRESAPNSRASARGKDVHSSHELLHSSHELLRHRGAVVVHNNWIVGKEHKVRRFENARLWSLSLPGQVASETGTQ